MNATLECSVPAFTHPSQAGEVLIWGVSPSRERIDITPFFSYHDNIIVFSISNGIAKREGSSI